MTIYICVNGDGTVTFKLWDADDSRKENLFLEDFNKNLQCNEKDTFGIMGEIDDWYCTRFKDGCVRFEFA